MIKLGNTKIIDIEKNHYKLEKSFLNLKSKKLNNPNIVYFIYRRRCTASHRSAGTSQALSGSSGNLQVLIP